MAKDNVIRQQHLPAYLPIEQTTGVVHVKRPRPTALLCYSICQAGQLTSIATLPYQRTNRYAVVNEMDIGLSANRVQQASYLMPSSYKRSGEFGIRAIRYVSYPYAVDGEVAIGFSPNRAQQASYPMPNSHKSRGEFGIRAILHVNYRIAVVGEMDIGLSPNRAQQALHLRSYSHKRRSEFELRAIRYVSYRVAVVGEIDICFSPNRAQQALYLRPHSHKSRGHQVVGKQWLVIPLLRDIHKKRRQEHTFLSA